MGLRKLIKGIVKEKIKLVTIDTDKEFIYFDKDKSGKWKLTISKSLLKD